MWKIKFCLAPPQQGGRQSEPGRAAGCCNPGCLTIWQCLLLAVMQSSEISCQKAPLFFSLSHFSVDDLAHVTVPERFLARCGRCDRGYWLLKSIRHCFLSASQIFKSFYFPPSPAYFLTFRFFSKVIHFATELMALSCLSSRLLSPFLRSFITLSIMPACLVMEAYGFHRM